MSYTAPKPDPPKTSREFTVTLVGERFDKDTDELERIIARFLAAELEVQVTVDYQMPF